MQQHTGTFPFQTNFSYCVHSKYSYVYKRMLQGCSIYASSCFFRCMKYISHVPLQGFRYLNSLPFQTHHQSGHCQTATSGTSIHSHFRHTTNLATVRLQLQVPPFTPISDTPPIWPLSDCNSIKSPHKYEGHLKRNAQNAIPTE